MIHRRLFSLEFAASRFHSARACDEGAARYRSKSRSASNSVPPSFDLAALVFEKAQLFLQARGNRFKRIYSSVHLLSVSSLIRSMDRIDHRSIAPLLDTTDSRLTSSLSSRSNYYFSFFFFFFFSSQNEWKSEKMAQNREMNSYRTRGRRARHYSIQFIGPRNSLLLFSSNDDQERGSPTIYDENAFTPDLRSHFYRIRIENTNLNYPYRETRYISQHTRPLSFPSIDCTFVIYVSPSPPGYAGNDIENDRIERRIGR